MNLLLRILVIAIVGSICQTYFPWWSAVVVAFLVELIIGNAKRDTFFAGFYGVSIPWMILSFYIDLYSDSILTFRILQLFNLPQFSMLLIIVTGLVGGLMGGLGSMSGGWVKALKTKK